MDENNANSGEKEEYVYLDFHGKLLSEVFKTKVFIRIANLSDPNPLVQINDMVFKGQINYSMGINMFFSKIERILPPNLSPFDNTTNIKLNYLLNQTKVIDLKQMRVPPRKIHVPGADHQVNYNWNWDYNELLTRFEQGTLTIEDIVNSDESLVQNENLAGSMEEDIYRNMDTDDNIELEVERNVPIHLPGNLSEDLDLENKPTSIKLENTYKKLQMLARQPARREKSPERIVACDDNLREKLEYSDLERQILQPAYNQVVENPYQVDEATLSDCVNIDRCVLYGIISSSNNIPRVLTNAEKEAILTFENFDNLLLPARHYVLKNEVECLEIEVSRMNKKELKTKDAFQRTPLTTLAIYKKLLNAVENRLKDMSSAMEGG